MGDIVAYRDSDFISDGMRQKSEFYQKWMRPMGVVYGCGINVFSHGVGFATVTFARDEGEGDFTDKELDILSVTARHLGEKFHQLYPVGVSYRGRGGRSRILTSCMVLRQRGGDLRDGMQRPSSRRNSRKPHDIDEYGQPT
ncbi:MAG: hypothetical protein ACLUW6_02610 [Coriobacteriaceae bacterium]